MRKKEKFDTLLGFTSSVFAGFLTGGTQVGKPFSVSERQQLEAQLKNVGEDIQISGVSELTEAFDAFREAFFEILGKGSDGFRPERVDPLFTFASIKSLAVINYLKENFNQVNNPVTVFVNAAKVLTVSLFFKNNRMEYGLVFKSADLEGLPQVPDNSHYALIKKEIEILRINSVIDKLMSSTAIEDGLCMMNCINRNVLPTAKTTSALSIGSGAKFSKQRNGSKTALEPNTEVATHAFSMKFRLRKASKKKKSSSLGVLEGNLNDAHVIVREVFLLSILLKKFHIFAPVLFNGREILANTVPQVFQTQYRSRFAEAEARMPIAFDVYKDYSIVLFEDRYIEVFDNRTQKSRARRQVDANTKAMFVRAYDEFLVVGAGASIYLFDLTSPDLEEVRVFTFRRNSKMITSLTTMASLLYVGLEDGSIAVWSIEPNKEIATFHVSREVHDEDLDLVVDYSTTIQFLSSDAFSRRIASVVDDYKLVFWKGIPKNQTVNIKHAIDSEHGKVTALVAHDAEVFTGGTDGCIRIWDIMSKKAIVLMRNAHFGLPLPLSLEKNKQSTRKKNEKKKKIKPKKLRRGSQASLLEEDRSWEKAPFAVTGLAVYNDLIFSSGMDKKLKIFDLTKLGEVNPNIIKKSNIIVQLKVVDRNLYMIGDQLDKYDIDGIAVEQVSPHSSNIQNELSFNYGASGAGVLGNTSSPELVMHVQKQQSLGSLSSDLNLEALSLRDALSSKRVRKAFMKYLRTAYADESLQFYIAVVRFEKFFDDFPEKTRERESRKIILTFIGIGAVKQINISDAVRHKILEGKVEKRMFRKAMDEVTYLMNTNFFMNFKKEAQFIPSKS